MPWKDLAFGLGEELQVQEDCCSNRSDQRKDVKRCGNFADVTIGSGARSWRDARRRCRWSRSSWRRCHRRTRSGAAGGWRGRRGRWRETRGTDWLGQFKFGSLRGRVVAFSGGRRRGRGCLGAHRGRGYEAVKKGVSQSVSGKFLGLLLTFVLAQ